MIDKNRIIEEFPRIELSYEKNNHKKVLNPELIFAIPKGTKCFAWFRKYENKNMCFILEVDTNNTSKIKHVKYVKCSYNKDLTLQTGTIFYGTLFSHLGSSFYSIEDIFYYKNINLCNEKYSEKINYLAQIFKEDIRQLKRDDYFVIFGLPLCATSIEELNNKLTTISYETTHFLNIKNNRKTLIPVINVNVNVNVNLKEMEENIPFPKEKTINIEKQYKENKIPSENYLKTFKIKPNIQNDIYHIYDLKENYIGLACIPDYETSVMMNKLFRSIKENDDLDKLEESDDEDEFENENVDKFVNLNASYKFVCKFNRKFKKWAPIKQIV